LTTVLVLAVDTATPAVTAGVVVLDGDAPPRPLAQRVTIDAKAHGELLTPHALAALAEAGATFADLAAVVVGAGPGPFTGLRAGMVTAAALGQALDLPVHPVPTPDAIALDALGVTTGTADPAGGRLLVATDARRREVYWAVYEADGRRLDGPHVQAPAELAPRLAELGVTRAAGQGAELYANVLGLPLVGPHFPSPAGLVAAAADQLRGHAEPAPLTPLYLRRPDAVEPAARKRVSQA
jgi:tRNA threonylcarbamoyl adenosine modification protein YeaZ